jgi:hypothetical protein
MSVVQPLLLLLVSLQKTLPIQKPFSKIASFFLNHQFAFVGFYQIVLLVGIYQAAL